MKKVLPYLVVIFLLLPASAQAGTAQLVQGTTYTNYSSLQSAINAGQPGDEVHVSSGTWQGNFTMKDGVNLLGGYSAADWSRDINANVTVLDAGGTGSTVTAANATIDGFTIKGCAATGIVAGIYVYNCSPTITDNILTGNGRHGIYVEGASSPVIEKNVIYSNSGHGIYCYSFGNGGTPEIYNNTIDGNQDGINLYAFSPLIKNNIVTNGTGYGISVAATSNPVVDYNDFWSNASGNYYVQAAGPHDKSVNPLYVGGGDYHLQTSPTVSPCIDAGTGVGLPYTGLPDMGAYESSVTQPNPWPPDGLTGTPSSAAVKLSWLANKETNIAGYKVSYGNVSGNYTNVIDVGNITDYDARSLINDAAYFFAVQAYNTLGGISGYSSEITATPTAGTRELPHYDWDASYGGGDCTACHYTNTGNGELLPSGYDYRYSGALCASCHNVAGQARDKVIDKSKQSHPVYVNVTTGGNNLPTYGNITGRFSNMMGTHLGPGNTIVCNTCHNIMEKTEDPGRTWEDTSFTGTGSWQTYALQRGGWSWYDYLQPKLHTSQTLITAPTYTKERRDYASSLGFDYNPSAGEIIFNAPFFDYAYITLDFPYLRVSNSDNVMCLDCHNMGTHQQENCLTCHESHNYSNLHGIRPRIKTPNSGIKTVVFLNMTGRNSFADGDATYDGVCEVCHTTTKYYRNDGTGFANHSGGFNYNGRDCTACHSHVGGFSKY